MEAKQINVLHLIDSGGLYGAEKMLLALGEEQSKQGIGVKLLTIRLPGEAPRAIEKEAKRLGLEVVPWEMRPGLNFSEALRIIKWARREKISVLHSHGYKFNVLVGLIPLVWRKIPIVSTVHGYTAKPGLSKMGFYLFMDKIALSWVDRVIYVSGKMGKGITTVKINKKRQIIPNGIPVNDELEGEGCSDVPVSLNGQYLLFVGRLSREKGCDLLLRAFSQIRKSWDIRLIVLGEGAEWHNLEQQAKELGLGGAVDFLGFRENVSAYMKSASALVMPSRMEGLPITLLEAMRDKVPIVASLVGGIPDVLGDDLCGRVVEPGNVCQLVKKIVLTLSDEEQTKILTENAFARFMAEYSSKRMTDQYLEVYKDLLNYG